MTADKLTICEALTRETRHVVDGFIPIRYRKGLANPDGPEAAAIIEGLVEALEAAREDVLCGRDYAHDAQSGALVCDTGEPISATMTGGDLERMTRTVEHIDEALAKVRAASNSAGGRG